MSTYKKIVKINKCGRCGHIYFNKDNLITHLLKKDICLPLLSNISRKELLKKLGTKRIPKIYRCHICNIYITSVKQSLNKHIPSCLKKYEIVKQ